jgi:hypothetical protein
MLLRSSVNFPAGQEISLSSIASRPVLGLSKPPVQWVSGIVSLAVGFPGRGHSLLSSV